MRYEVPFSKAAGLAATLEAAGYVGAAVLPRRMGDTAATVAFNLRDGQDRDEAHRFVTRVQPVATWVSDD